MLNECPVCNYTGLHHPPYNNYGYGSDEICPCCGFQFGYDDYPDKEDGQKKWRQKWIQNGYKWFSRSRLPPVDWNPEKQLKKSKE